MRLVDSHAHLQADAFGLDRSAVMAAASAAGVERILVPGWDAASSSAALDLAVELGWIDAAAGIHPHDASAATDSDWATIERLADDPRVVAIGETGLDFDRMHSPPEAQLANLRRHLRLALAAGKPAILHCRSAAGRCDAQDALIAELRVAGFGGKAARGAFGDRPPAILHSFSGSVEYARAALDLGLAISFGGLVFRRGEESSAEVARLVPAGRLLVESDSPYLAPPGVPRYRPAVVTTARPAPAAGTASAEVLRPSAGEPAVAADSTAVFHGRRNSPEWVRITAGWLAECRGETPGRIGEGLIEAYDATFRGRFPG